MAIGASKRLDIMKIKICVGSASCLPIYVDLQILL